MFCPGLGIWSSNEDRDPGNTSESAVLHSFLKRGYQAMLPFGGGCPFDLVVFKLKRDGAKAGALPQYTLH
jgi:hypothetical protein